MVKTEKGGTLSRNCSALVTIAPRKNAETGHSDTKDIARPHHSEEMRKLRRLQIQKNLLPPQQQLLAQKIRSSHQKLHVRVET